MERLHCRMNNMKERSHCGMNIMKEQLHCDGVLLLYRVWEKDTLSLLLKSQIQTMV